MQFDRNTDYPWDPFSNEGHQPFEFLLGLGSGLIRAIRLTESDENVFYYPYDDGSVEENESVEEDDEAE
eukprot:5926719-Ditylum_brightwellii.AAC.1